MEKPKIAILYIPGCGRFLDWIEPLKDRYEIKLFEINQQKDVAWPITWGDIIWFEFASEAAIWGTQDPNIIYKKVVLRLHSYEVLTGHWKLVNWSMVHELIFVAEHIKNLFDKLEAEKNVKSN